MVLKCGTDNLGEKFTKKLVYVESKKKVKTHR